jgi:hypothetical protein
MMVLGDDYSTDTMNRICLEKCIITINDSRCMGMNTPEKSLQGESIQEVEESSYQRKCRCGNPIANGMFMCNQCRIGYFPKCASCSAKMSRMTQFSKSICVPCYKLFPLCSCNRIIIGTRACCQGCRVPRRDMELKSRYRQLDIRNMFAPITSASASASAPPEIILS